MITGICPECDSAIRFASQPRAGKRISCQTCSTALTVLLENPITLDWAFIEPLSKEGGKQEHKHAAEGKMTGIVPD
jgi:hypothetical protein